MRSANAKSISRAANRRLNGTYYKSLYRERTEEKPSAKKNVRAHRRRTWWARRGVILILLVLGIIWGITALVRRNLRRPTPHRSNAGQQTGTTDEKQNNRTPEFPGSRPRTVYKIRLRNQPLTPLRSKPTPDSRSLCTARQPRPDPGSDDWRTIMVKHHQIPAGRRAGYGAGISSATMPDLTWRQCAHCPAAAGDFWRRPRQMAMTCSSSAPTAPLPAAPFCWKMRCRRGR